MKRIVALLLSICTLSTLFIAVCYAKEFPDVDATHWAHRYIDELSNDGIINGYDDGTYKPSGTVKRSEFIKLVIAACLPEDEDVDDIPRTFNHWAAPYVWFAEQYGVVAQGEYTKDNLDQPITRLEMVKLISNADILLLENIPLDERPEQEFIDVADLSDEDYYLLCHAFNKGLVKGYEDFTFKPEKTMTRAEAATMIWRFNGGKEVAE